MELEFDKEMDALLRQTARGETAFADSKFQISNSKSPHLDADEISAFAENALPEKTKSLYTAHFADCRRCRKILSNVVASNAETQTETAAQSDKIKIAAIAVIPWYKKLFAVPNLAYAMGALALVFAGLIVFTFLKNAPQTAEVSQAISEKPINMRGASGDGETVSTERESAPTASMSNAGSMTNSAAMTNSMQSNSAATRGGSMSNGSMSNGAGVSNKSTDAKDDAKNKSEDEPATTPNENQARSSNFAEQKTQTVDKEKERAPENDDASNNQAASKPAAPKQDAPAKSAATNTRSAAELSDGAQNKKVRRAETETAATRTVNGVNFRRAGGVWYDAAYNGQSARDVARGSIEYKKLDSGLRSIAENLAGTIVVVWKEKAYRIQ